MAWIAVNKDGQERIFQNKPTRDSGRWLDFFLSIVVPVATSLILTGRQLTWNDEPVELKEVKE